MMVMISNALITIKPAVEKFLWAIFSLLGWGRWNA